MKLTDEKNVNCTITRRNFSKQCGLVAIGAVIAPAITTSASGRLITSLNNEKNMKYDTLIIGGSYSGLSAAMTLGRSLRKVLIIDSGKPCNEQTPYAHNFITHDKEKPSNISKEAKTQVLEYPTVSFKNGIVTDVSGKDKAFKVSANDGSIYDASKIIFATGVKDIMPKLDGFSDCWGITAIHCPYCHGYEVKSNNTGILVNDESALDFARLISNWTDDLTIYTNGKAVFDVKPITKLAVVIETRELKKIHHSEGYMTSIEFKDESQTDIEALYYRAPFVQHCDIPFKLGCELTESGHILVDDFQKTSIAGIYAVGDSTTPFRALSIATASGSKAAFILNHELIQEKYI